MTSPSQMAELSPLAKERLSKWLKEKDYGAEIDGEFIPAVQLSIGQIVECLDDLIDYGWYHIERNGERDGWRMTSDDIEFNQDGGEELIDVLFDELKKILEQKN